MIRMPTNMLAGFLLRLMAVNFNFRTGLRQYMKDADGWINFSVGMKTETGTLCAAIVFHNGTVRVVRPIPPTVDVTLRFADDDALMEMLRITPNEMLTMILHNRMVLEGNLATLQLFNFYISLLLGGKHRRMLEKRHARDVRGRKKRYGAHDPRLAEALDSRKRGQLAAPTRDKGVFYLHDPYLSQYRLDDFPRVKAFLDVHFTAKPVVCTERPRLITQWHRANGFETRADGAPWSPALRQAYAFKHLMENKKPVIRQNDLVAGTTTASETCGVVIYPDAQGTMIWGELNSVDHRILNPYHITQSDIRELHHDILPFWLSRNFREWVRTKYDYPLCQRLEERWVAYFVWKSVGISHTIPDFPMILEKGVRGITGEIDAKLAAPAGPGRTPLSAGQKDVLSAMKISLQGLAAYALGLSEEAARLAAGEADPARKKELAHLADICRRVPHNPARTLDEAVNSVWITWVALHMENTNTGLSFGRLDQWLQPYFAADMEKLSTREERDDYLRHAIELIGCFFMRGTDHLPLVPDIGNYLFGGSSSDQAITLGGITPDGKDGVNDMTYIFLKVTEMLSIRDPNVNARFHPKINSDAYLKRLCEVNLVTAATPSMHNDRKVMESLAPHGYPDEDMRDWAATGCVEPTLCGRHMGHTGSILMNIVAGMEMALNNGAHPHFHEQGSPKTGRIENGDFDTFENFFRAYLAQQQFLIDNAVTLNNMLAEAHEFMRPTPLLSALMRGCLEKGADVTAGGAAYNTSGTANIGLADVTDSLMAIKTLVFDTKAVSFARLKKALLNSFDDDPELRALIQSRVSRFGSGSRDAVDMANRVTAALHRMYGEKRNHRGGVYTTGFWSMSQHVAYGNLSGALPSGRIAGKAFTPGLTPNPEASMTFLDNIRDVAQLDPVQMDNNIAFNVKLNPASTDTRQKTVDTMHAYVKTYFDLGGMQMQFNVVNADMLKDAMANPEHYRNLLVRISGYNAYFVTLNRDMQIELIERAEFGM
ncbi:MAG: pyruvate formate lyase family protein [Thermodesulfobacteriota bacterium]